MFRKRRAAKSSGRRSGFLRLNEGPHALSFDDDDRPPGRAGDLRPEHEVLEEFPPSRVRYAGLTGASIPGGEVTADDLSPETLLDDNLSHSPSAPEGREALDTMLRSVAETEIGAGNGPDEAEESWAEPIATGEGAQRQRK